MGRSIRQGGIAVNGEPARPEDLTDERHQSPGFHALTK
jgi:hypothetical protein